MGTEIEPATAVEPAPDRRARSRERRRNEVFAAAVELFTEQGFESTTMEQIAARADVARATVFNHFPRKTAFLDEWSARRRQRALDAIYAEHLEHHSVREVIGRYMVELARVSTETRPETVALISAAVHATDMLARPALAAELGALLGRARRAGDLAADVDTDLAGLLLAVGYFGVLTAWISAEPAPFVLERQLAGMSAIVLDGVLPR